MSFGDSDSEVRRTLTIRNSRGLHARAAGKLAQTAGRYEAEIWVMRADMVVTADSIMGLMMLAATPGCAVDVWARGPEALEAMQAIEELVERGFDEDVSTPAA